jgi:hypothetical protein
MLIKYFFAYCLYILYILLIDYLGIRFFSKPPLPPQILTFWKDRGELQDPIPRITWCIEFSSVTPETFPSITLGIFESQ